MLLTESGTEPGEIVAAVVVVELDIVAAVDADVEVV
jgi:hypothetical protein